MFQELDVDEDQIKNSGIVKIDLFIKFKVSSILRNRITFISFI